MGEDEGLIIQILASPSPGVKGGEQMVIVVKLTSLTSYETDYS